MQEKKKMPSEKVGEMGKPSLKNKFESSMQKQFKSRPENKDPKIRYEKKLRKAVENLQISKSKPSHLNQIVEALRIKRAASIQSSNKNK